LNCELRRTISTIRRRTTCRSK